MTAETLTASAILAAAETATPDTGDAAPRVWDILTDPVRHGTDGPAYGLRQAQGTATVYVFRRTFRRDGTHTDKNVCPALDAARASAVGII